MVYDPKTILKDFNKRMADIRKEVPSEYDAFIKEKETILESNRLSEKTKWLLLLVSSVSQKCPVCLARAVTHCLEQGWTKKEMLEACMVAVLVGGASTMTYVTMVDQTIEELKKK
jgi:alkylhydroperoxidase/carboxymuconolactone decarboxylase family protein YurZ